jgi:signal transduction histidine kinase
VSTAARDAGRLAADRLPGVLGHELRNPLASALTGAMLVREMVDADDPRASLLDGVLRDLDRVAALTDGWLALARGGGCKRQRVPMVALLCAIAARHRAQLVACAADAFVDGDRALLERLFDNLCENAAHAGASTIRIALQSLGDELAVHVEDDGSGVRPEHVERVFAAGWSSRGGAGLGLHAVAATATAHGGHVRCVPLPRGTRFTVTLPRARTAATTA